jgi:hypothetical protein
VDLPSPYFFVAVEAPGWRGAARQSCASSSGCATAWSPSGTTAPTGSLEAGRELRSLSASAVLLLADIVEVSRSLAARRSRREKIDGFAALLAAAAGKEQGIMEVWRSAALER